MKETVCFPDRGGRLRCLCFAYVPLRTSEVRCEIQRDRLSFAQIPPESRGALIIMKRSVVDDSTMLQRFAEARKENGVEYGE